MLCRSMCGFVVVTDHISCCVHVHVHVTLVVLGGCMQEHESMCCDGMKISELWCSLLSAS